MRGATSWRRAVAGVAAVAAAAVGLIAPVAQGASTPPPSAADPTLGPVVVAAGLSSTWLTPTRAPC